MRIHEVLIEASKWGKRNGTYIYENPTRGEFLGMMNRLRSRNSLGPDEVVLRGFLNGSDNIIVFSGWNLTHDDVESAFLFDHWFQKETRLSFWTDTGVVGIGNEEDASVVEGSTRMQNLMGGPFKTELCW